MSRLARSFPKVDWEQDDCRQKSKENKEKDDTFIHLSASP
jgi:hypothetical protein